MLNQVLQEIKSTPSQEPIYWQATLLVLRTKYAVKQCLNILIRAKITREHCTEILTTLTGYHAKLTNAINNNNVTFIDLGPISFVGLINDALNALSSYYGAELPEFKKIRYFLDYYGFNAEITDSSQLDKKKDALIAALSQTIYLLSTLKNILENNVGNEITYYLQQQSINISKYADIISITQDIVRHIDSTMAIVPRQQVYEALSKVPNGLAMYHYIYDQCAEGHEKNLPNEFKKAVQLVQSQHGQGITTHFQSHAIYSPKESVYQTATPPIQNYHQHDKVEKAVVTLTLSDEDDYKKLTQPKQSSPEVIATKPTLSEKDETFLELYCESFQNHSPPHLEKETGLRPSAPHKPKSSPALKRSTSAANLAGETDNANTITASTMNFFRKFKNALQTKKLPSSNKIKKTQSMYTLTDSSLQEESKTEYGHIRILGRGENLDAIATTNSVTNEKIHTEIPQNPLTMGLGDAKGESALEDRPIAKRSGDENPRDLQSKPKQGIFALLHRNSRNCGKPTTVVRAPNHLTKLPEDSKGEALAEKKEAEKAAKKAKKEASKKRKTEKKDKARQKSIEENNLLDEQRKLVITEKQQNAQREDAKGKETPTLTTDQFNQLASELIENYLPEAKNLSYKKEALAEDKLPSFLSILTKLQDNAAIFLSHESKKNKNNRKLRLLKSEISQFHDLMTQGIIPRSINSYVKTINSLCSDDLTLISFSRFYLVVRAFAQCNLAEKWLENFMPEEYQKFLETLEALAKSYFIFTKECDNTNAVKTKRSFEWMRERVYYLKDISLIYEVLKKKDILDGKKDTLRSIVITIEQDILKSMCIEEENKIDLFKKFQPKTEHCKKLLDVATHNGCEELSSLLLSIAYPDMADLNLLYKNSSVNLSQLLMEKNVDPFLVYDGKHMAFESILNGNDTKNIIFCIESIESRWNQLISDGQLTTVFNSLSQFLIRSNGGTPEIREAIKQLFKAKMTLKNFKLNASSTISKDINFKSLFDEIDKETSTPDTAKPQQSNNVYSFYQKQKDKTIMPVSEAADQSKSEIKTGCRT